MPEGLEPCTPKITKTETQALNAEGNRILYPKIQRRILMHAARLKIVMIKSSLAVSDALYVLLCVCWRVSQVGYSSRALESQRPPSVSFEVREFVYSSV